MLTWPGWGLYVHSPRADSAYDAPQAEKNRGYTSREMGKPMVIDVGEFPKLNIDV